MKKTGRIAARELRSLFVSPVAWVVFVVYTLYLSSSYIGSLVKLMRWQLNAIEPQFTSTLFGSGTDGVFQSVANALIVFVPLLTMGVISRERQNGSLKLLMSSPVSDWQVVLGKYLAIATYLMALISMLSALVLFSGAIIEHFEYERAFAGLLGLYLLACAYAAIGLFISSLTRQQVVAAIVTFVVLGLLGVVGEMGQRIPLLSEVGFWLSMEGRFAYFRNGVIASGDVAYFLLIILMYLAFTQMTLTSGRIRASGFRHAAKFAGVFVVVVSAGLLSSLHGFRVDMDLTVRGERSLTANSREALANLESGVDVLVLVNVLAGRASRHEPANRVHARRRYFEPFERELGQFDFEYRYYYARPEGNKRLFERHPGKTAEDLARQYAALNRMDFAEILPPDEADALYRTSLEGNGTFYVLWHGNERAVIRPINDVRYYPNEGQIGAALRSLVDGPVTVAYVTGNDERSARSDGSGHKYMITDRQHRRSLINHGFRVVDLSLSAPVPDEVDVLVWAGPGLALADEAVLNLRQYVATGKNLLVMAEPGTETFVNDALGDVAGVRFEEAVPGNAGRELPEDMIVAELDQAASRLGYNRSFRQAETPLVLSGAVALDVAGDTAFTVTPLVSLGAASTGRGSMSASPKAATTLIGAALEREVSGRTQRMVVIGDANFLSTDVVRLPDPQLKLNRDFINDTFHFLSGGLYPIDTSRPDPLDTSSRLSLADIAYLRAVLFGLIPAVFLLFGGTVLLNRRRA